MRILKSGKPEHLRLVIFAFALVLAPAAVFAERIGITPEEIEDLRAHRTTVDKKLKEVNESHKVLLMRQGEISSAKELIKQLQEDSDRARADLEELQAMDRRRPGIIAPERLRESENENRRAFRALSDAQAKLNNLESQLIDLNTTAIRLNTEFDQLRKSYEDRVDAVVDRQVEERIRGLQVSKVTEASATVACENVTVEECKQRALKQAELRASEQGSVVVVDSLTEVKNFKLTKEELRSEVRATLSNREILSSRWISDSTYETRIRATVVPAISPSLRQELRGAVRSDVTVRLGGPLNYSVVRPAATPSPAVSEDVPRREPPRALDNSRRQTSEERSRIEQEQRALEEERRRIEAEREELAEARRRAEAQKQADKRKKEKTRATIVPTF